MELTWERFRRLLVDGNDFIMPCALIGGTPPLPTTFGARHTVEIWKAIHPDHTA
jgi:hypothetical protein